MHHNEEKTLLATTRENPRKAKITQSCQKITTTTTKKKPGKAMNNLKPDLRGQEEIWLTGRFEETEQDHGEIAV